VEFAHLEETLATLRFATRMMRVHNEPVINIEIDPEVKVKKLEKEIQHLKSELAMHNNIAGKGRVNYDPYTEDQKQELREALKKYFNNSLEEIQLESLRQMKELLSQAKVLFHALMSECEQKSKSIPQQSQDVRAISLIFFLFWLISLLSNRRRNAMTI
jgi:kinesin family protein 6/9